MTRLIGVFHYCLSSVEAYWFWMCCVRKPVATAHCLDLAQGLAECVDWLTLSGQLHLRTLCYSFSLLNLVLYKIDVPLLSPSMTFFYLSSFQVEDVTGWLLELTCLKPQYEIMLKKGQFSSVNSGQSPSPK